MVLCDGRYLPEVRAISYVDNLTFVTTFVPLLASWRCLICNRMTEISCEWSTSPENRHVLKA